MFIAKIRIHIQGSSGSGLRFLTGSVSGFYWIRIRNTDYEGNKETLGQVITINIQNVPIHKGFNIYIWSPPWCRAGAEIFGRLLPWMVEPAINAKNLLKIFEKFKYTKKRLLSLAFKFYCHKKRFLMVSDHSTVGTGTYVWNNLIKMKIFKNIKLLQKKLKPKSTSAPEFFLAY